MKTSTRALMAGAMGAAMLVTVPASAADPAAWLQRQFTTDHREAGATPGVVPVVGSPEPGARSTDGSGHAFAQAWLKRQFAGATLVAARSDGVAGRAGPIDRTDTTTPLSDSWLRHQFTTDHPGAKSPY